MAPQLLASPEEEESTMPSIGTAEVVIIAGIVCLGVLLVGGVAALFVWVIRRSG